MRALKKAENSDEMVVRVQELYGRQGRTRITLEQRIEPRVKSTRPKSPSARSLRLAARWMCRSDRTSRARSPSG